MLHLHRLVLDISLFAKKMFMGKSFSFEILCISFENFINLCVCFSLLILRVG